MDFKHALMTVGTVVDTNDPQQMGRLRVSCPKWGDTNETLIANIPWAVYVSPFGGILTRGTRGPEEATTSGPVAYGMWAIPKVGSTVVCMLIDGDPNHRAWIGSIPANHMVHTMPMGRFLDGGTTGPVSSTEQPIEPLASNMSEAFAGDKSSYEWQTRAAENQVGSISPTIIDKVASSRADDRSSVSRTGYQQSRIRGDLESNYDPQIYSITSPGMHSFVMDDSLKNGKIRIRSTSGNQIILDDTNERIYISTAEGKSWIEIDRAGNIDIHSDRRVSMRAAKGFNFTTEGSFRVSANSIHLNAAEDVRIGAGGKFAAYSTDTMVLETENEFHVTSGSHMFLTSSTLDVASSGQIAMDGSIIELNSGLATTADSVAMQSAHAYVTSRVPVHEPWGRISNNPSQTDNDASQTLASLVFNMTKDSSILELPYTSGNANKVDLGDDLGRNDNWRR